ncbi:MAG: LysE family transporter [Anaerolineae bacterium]|nr:LysE family transporter [Anaerolineae bacterium]
MTSNFSQPFLQGFLLYAGIIVAFGPQNLYLLRQGMRRQYLFATVLVTSLVDIALIGLGVGGLGAMITGSQTLLRWGAWVGSIVLCLFALRSFRSAWDGQDFQNAYFAQSTSATLKGAVVSAMSFSLLNPAAYVDTLLVVGTSSSQYAVDERMLFGFGAMLAACIWFFGLTYSASRLSAFFRNAASWKVLDILSGCVMLWLAVSLFASN